MRQCPPLAAFCQFENNEKTRQNAESKQTFDLMGEIDSEKTRQNADSKQT